MMSFGKHGNEP